MTSVSNYFTKEYYGLTIPNASPKGGVSNSWKNNYNDSEGEQRAVLVVWLNNIIPNLSLPVKASAEELRACLIDGTILCQILRRLRPVTANEDVASASESRSETIKRFLVAMDEMRIPRFEMSDLEQGSMTSVVECLLKLKALFMSKVGADNVPIGSLFAKSENNTGDFKCQRPQCGPVLPDPPGALIHHVGHKFHEVFQLKQGCYADIPAARISEMMKSNSLDNAPTQSLLSVVNGILDESVERKNGEIPHRVACLLRKVVQEIERRISTQAEHLRTQNNLFKTREEKYQSRIKVLETLASGTSEETQIVMNKLQQVKTEKTIIEEKKKLEEHDVVKLMEEKDQYNLEISALKQELEIAKTTYENRCLQMEVKAGNTEEELHGRLTDLELLLEKSREKVKELEAYSKIKTEKWNRKEHIYKIYIDFQIGKLNELRCSSESIKKNILDTQRSYSEEFNLLGVNVKALADAAANYDDVFAENRRLFNEVQELKGNIRVYCRIRPFLSGQTASESTIEHIGENGELVFANPLKQGNDGHRLFRFNKVFGPDSTQAEVFSDTQPLVRSVLDGYNVCIFAYGQTGSGKTYTMTGPAGASKEKEDWGVNYRALNDLFHFAQSRKSSFIYEISVQMVEIYNEQVHDLLSSDGTQKKLGIVNSSQPNGIAVPDASMHTVKSTSHVLNLMDVGQKNRAVGATALNTRSSRSHCVVTILVHGTDVKCGSTFHGNLHLVDLAGSERVDRSEAVGERLKEAQHINKSLSALGDVIFALSQHNSHVPYRNSKLTQLLHTSLGGQAKTLMFVQLNPDLASFSESLSTLKFAERVAGVELGAARSSKDGRDVRDLIEQVSFLKGIILKKDEEIEKLRALKDMKNVVFRAGVNGPLKRRESSPNLQKASRAVSDGGDSEYCTGVVDEGSDISDGVLSAGTDTDVFVESTTGFSDTTLKAKSAPLPVGPKAVRPPKKPSGSDSVPTDEILKVSRSLRKAPAPTPIVASPKSSKRWQ